LSPLILNFALEYAIRKVQENHMGQKFNGTHLIQTYAYDVNLLGDNMNTIRESTGSVTYAGKELVDDHL
jgi:hypothetical protein